MTTHDLKTWPVPFQAVIDGTKRHELRRNDRDFKVGDRLRLQEYILEESRYTGREISVAVTYVTIGPQFGLPSDMCVMSISCTDPRHAMVDELADALSSWSRT